MAVGNYIYALEGWPNSPSSDNMVRRYDGAADTWRADLASPPFTGQVVSTSGNQRTQGAWDGAYWYVLGPDQKLYRYNPVANTWSGALAGGAVILSGGVLEDHPYWMCSDGRFIYIMDTPVADTSSGNTFRQYDPALDAVTILTSLPGAQQGFSSRAVLVWDGADGIYSNHGDTAGQFYKFSIAGNSWTTLAASPAGLQTMQAASGCCWGGFILGKLWYLGVGSGTASAFSYNPSGNTWTTKATFATSSVLAGDCPFGDIDDNRIWIANRDTNGGSLTYDAGADSWSSGSFSPASMNAQGHNTAVARSISPSANWFQANGTTPLDVTQILGAVHVGETQTYHAVVKLTQDRPAGVAISVATDVASDADDSITVCATSGGVYASSFATGALTAGQAVDVFIKNVPFGGQTQGVGKSFQLKVS